MYFFNFDNKFYIEHFEKLDDLNVRTKVEIIFGISSDPILQMEVQNRTAVITETLSCAFFKPSASRRREQ